MKILTFALAGALALSSSTFALAQGHRAVGTGAGRTSATAPSGMTETHTDRVLNATPGTTTGSAAGSTVNSPSPMNPSGNPALPNNISGNPALGPSGD